MNSSLINLRFKNFLEKSTKNGYNIHIMSKETLEKVTGFLITDPLSNDITQAVPPKDVDCIIDHETGNIVYCIKGTNTKIVNVSISQDRYGVINFNFSPPNS